MDIKEYLNQVEPKRGNTVHLKEGEFVLGHSQPYEFNARIRSVYIDAFPGVEYRAVNDVGTLYTCDRNGNIKRQSCFRI